MDADQMHERLLQAMYNVDKKSPEHVRHECQRVLGIASLLLVQVKPPVGHTDPDVLIEAAHVAGLLEGAYWFGHKKTYVSRTRKTTYRDWQVRQRYEQLETATPSRSKKSIIRQLMTEFKKKSDKTIRDALNAEIETYEEFSDFL